MSDGCPYFAMHVVRVHPGGCLRRRVVADVAVLLMCCRVRVRGAAAQPERGTVPAAPEAQRHLTRGPLGCWVPCSHVAVPYRHGNGLGGPSSSSGGASGGGRVGHGILARAAGRGAAESLKRWSGARMSGDRVVVAVMLGAAEGRQAVRTAESPARMSAQTMAWLLARIMHHAHTAVPSCRAAPRRPDPVHMLEARVSCRPDAEGHSQSWRHSGEARFQPPGARAERDGQCLA